MKIKRDFDFLSEDQRRSAIEQIISYFQEERNEKMGVIAAEHLLDFFLREMGNTIYNQALDNVKPFLDKNLERTFLDIDTSLRKLENILDKTLNKEYNR